MKPYHILLVEDDRAVLEENRRRLETEGYRVSTAAAAAAARKLFNACLPDLAVLDILLPDGSGLDLCRELRAATPVPVLFLTSLDDKRQVIEGLRAGGDDYLTKPYHLEELLARVESLLRRVELLRASPESLEQNGLRLDLIRQHAYWRERDLLLKPKEFQLLALLMKHRNRYSTTKELYMGVWGQAAIESRPVIVHLSSLRLKLDKAGCTFDVEHIRDRGYRLVKRQNRKKLRREHQDS